MTKIRIAILDLYEGHANEGMRCILDILQQTKTKHHQLLEWEVFDVRKNLNFLIPDLICIYHLGAG